jgi:hypothetical protein
LVNNPTQFRGPNKTTHYVIFSLQGGPTINNKLQECVRDMT